MFIGHFDLIWPILVLLGIETVRIERAASSPFLRLRFVHYPWDRAGTWAFWAFVAFLVIAYASSLAGGPPPSARVVAASALVGWILIPWIAWFDRHREVVAPQSWRP